MSSASLLVSPVFLRVRQDPYKSLPLAGRKQNSRSRGFKTGCPCFNVLLVFSEFPNKTAHGIRHNALFAFRTGQKFADKLFLLYRTVNGSIFKK